MRQQKLKNLLNEMLELYTDEHNKVIMLQGELTRIKNQLHNLDDIKDRLNDIDNKLYTLTKNTEKFC